MRARKGWYAAHVEGTAGKFGNDLGVDDERRVDNSDEREGGEGNDATGYHSSDFRRSLSWTGRTRMRTKKNRPNTKKKETIVKFTLARLIMLNLFFSCMIFFANNDDNPKLHKEFIKSNT